MELQTVANLLIVVLALSRAVPTVLGRDWVGPQEQRTRYTKPLAWTTIAAMLLLAWTEFVRLGWPPVERPVMQTVALVALVNLVPALLIFGGLDWRERKRVKRAKRDS